MPIVKVKIQSLEDAANGIPIVEGLDPTQPSQVESTEDLTFAILEGGMQSGRSSVMFILKMDDGSVKVAECSARNFEMMVGSFRGAIQRFGK